MPTLLKKTDNYASKYEVAEVQRGVDALTGKIETVNDTVNALVESLKGANKPYGERREIIERHIADATTITDRPNRSIPVIGEHTSKIGADFLTKGITPDMPHEEANKVFYAALKSPTDDEKLLELQTRCDRIKMKCEMLDKPPRGLKEYKGFQAFLEKSGFEDVIKIIGTSTTTNFVPEGWSNEVQKYYYLGLKVAALFREFTMPQNPFRWDILGRPTAHRRAQPTASERGVVANEITASDPVQGVVTFEAEVLTVRVDLTEEFAEDTIDTYYDTLSREIIPEAMAEGVEKAIINGDSDRFHAPRYTG